MISEKRCVLAFLFCKSSLQTNTQTEGSRPQSLHSSAAVATSLHLLFRCFLNQMQVVALQLSPRCSRACLSFRTDKSRLFQEGQLLPFCLLYRKQIRPPSCISLYMMEFFHSSHTLRQTVCASLGSDAQSLELCQSEFSRNKSRKSLRESGQCSGEVTAVNY